MSSILYVHSENGHLCFGIVVVPEWGWDVLECCFARKTKVEVEGLLFFRCTMK